MLRCCRSRPRTTAMHRPLRHLRAHLAPQHTHCGSTQPPWHRCAGTPPGTGAPGARARAGVPRLVRCNVSSLAQAKTGAQSSLVHARYAAVEREWRAMAEPRDQVRLTDCGGAEAAWVTACPTRPEYELASADWRDAILLRLGAPLDSLISGPRDCDCHDSAARNVHRVCRPAKTPPKVDALGYHDQSCRFSWTTGRHDHVQHHAIQRCRRGGKQTSLASALDLREAVGATL